MVVQNLGGGGGGVKKVKQMKLCANGSYNFQHVGSCCVPLHVAKRLTSVKLCATCNNRVIRGVKPVKFFFVF